MICKNCARDLPEPRFPKYATASRQHKGYRMNICRKCLRDKQLNLGLCRCGQPLATDKRSCVRCLKAHADSNLKRRKLDRVAAINHYGGCCRFCGESLFVFLTIDHINGGGNQHRRSLTDSFNRYSKLNSGVDIGKWLRRNNYPGGFQVLCVNCNHAKGRVGEAALIEILREAGRLFETPCESR
jgi:hypothetical protein